MCKLWHWGCFFSIRTSWDSNICPANSMPLWAGSVCLTSCRRGQCSGNILTIPSSAPTTQFTFRVWLISLAFSRPGNYNFLILWYVSQIQCKDNPLIFLIAFTYIVHIWIFTDFPIYPWQYVIQPRQQARSCQEHSAVGCVWFRIAPSWS